MISRQNTVLGISNLLSDCFVDSDLFLLNDGSPTRYDKFHNTYSHIDLTFCSLSLAEKLDWAVKESLYNSDHFPITVKYAFNQMYVNNFIRYKMAEANWARFAQNIKLPNIFTNVNDDCNTIVDNILEVSSQCIPKKNPVINTKYRVIWWRDSCKVALYNARKQFRILQRNHTVQNIVEYNRLEAAATLEIKEAKHTSWISFLQKVSYDTSLTEVWGVIRALSGKHAQQSKIVLDHNGLCSCPKLLSNIFGNHFSQVSSTNNYTDRFKLFKEREERNIIVFPPDNDAFYNQNFTLQEFEHAIKNTTSTSPGPEGVHYDMLMKLPK